MSALCGACGSGVLNIINREQVELSGHVEGKVLSGLVPALCGANLPATRPSPFSLGYDCALHPRLHTGVKG
jgi:hypothetical protein